MGWRVVLVVALSVQCGQARCRPASPVKPGGSPRDGVRHLDLIEERRQCLPGPWPQSGAIKRSVPRAGHGRNHAVSTTSGPRPQSSGQYHRGGKLLRAPQGSSGLLGFTRSEPAHLLDLHRCTLTHRRQVRLERRQVLDVVLRLTHLVVQLGGRSRRHAHNAGGGRQQPPWPSVAITAITIQGGHSTGSLRNVSDVGGAGRRQTATRVGARARGRFFLVRFCGQRTSASSAFHDRIARERTQPSTPSTTLDSCVCSCSDSEWKRPRRARQNSSSVLRR